MLRQPDPSPWPAPPANRRLLAVKIFVLVAAVLVVGVVIFCLTRRGARAAAAPPDEVAAAPTPAGEWQPPVNEYLYEDRYVLEFPVPGAEPVVRVDWDPHAHRRVLVVTWSAPERAEVEGKKRYTRQEWKRSSFTRRLPLPECVETPTATLKDGVLTLSFPHQRPFHDTIVPRREN